MVCLLETPLTALRIGPRGERTLRPPRPRVDDDDDDDDEDVMGLLHKNFAVAYWLQQQTDFSTRPIKLVHIVQSTASLLYSILYCRAGPSYPMGRWARAPKAQGPQTAHALFFIS